MSWNDPIREWTNYRIDISQKEHNLAGYFEEQKEHILDQTNVD